MKASENAGSPQGIDLCVLRPVLILFVYKDHGTWAVFMFERQTSVVHFKMPYKARVPAEHGIAKHGVAGAR